MQADAQEDSDRIPPSRADASDQPLGDLFDSLVVPDADRDEVAVSVVLRVPVRHQVVNAEALRRPTENAAADVREDRRADLLPVGSPVVDLPWHPIPVKRSSNFRERGPVAAPGAVSSARVGLEDAGPNSERSTTLLARAIEPDGVPLAPPGAILPPRLRWIGSECRPARGALHGYHWVFRNTRNFSSPGSCSIIQRAT